MDLLSEKNRLEDLLREDGHTLTPTSEGYKLSSPFHNDSNPSCFVNAAKQVWMDYSGGDQDGGGVIQYVQKRDGIDYLYAVKILCKRAGLKPPDISDEDFAKEFAQEEERKKVRGILTAIAKYCHENLPDEIREIVKSHYGLSDESIDRFGLGYVSGDLVKHVKKDLGLSNKEILSTGMFSFKWPVGLLIPPKGQEPDYEKLEIRCVFHDRILFPYWRKDSVAYATARLIPGTQSDSRKYTKLQTYDPGKRPYISKTVKNETIYNEDDAQGAQTLVITEGVTDLISACQVGYHCISPVTTKFPDTAHKKLIDLCSRVEKVVIVNDSERNRAGEKGAISTAKLLHNAGIPVAIGILPRPEDVDKVDVNSFVKEHGAKAPDRGHRRRQVLHRLPPRQGGPRCKTG